MAMPAAATARYGFVTCDDLRGPDLGTARWSPARLPLSTGDDHIALDPAAEVAVGEGEVRVAISRFSMAHGTFQPSRQRQVPHLLDGPVRAARIGPRRSPPTSPSRTSAGTRGTTTEEWPHSTRSTSR
jgi:hypothetical protein